ncbi:MAG: TnpV protein [Clostridiales bacterium]|nr:TnpV protein [Clostridiales bacterium]
MQERLDYTRKGDYLYPSLTITENTPEDAIGKYGMLKKEYLQENHGARYSSLLLTGRLWEYLADVEKQCQERLEVLMQYLEEKYPGPDKTEQMAWVRHENSLKAMAEETIYQELIYI